MVTKARTKASQTNTKVGYAQGTLVSCFEENYNKALVKDKASSVTKRQDEEGREGRGEEVGREVGKRDREEGYEKGRDLGGLPGSGGKGVVRQGEEEEGEEEDEKEGEKEGGVRVKVAVGIREDAEAVEGVIQRIVEVGEAVGEVGLEEATVKVLVVGEKGRLIRRREKVDHCGGRGPGGVERHRISRTRACNPRPAGQKEKGGDEEVESLGDVEVVKDDDEEGREGKTKLGEGEAKMSNREAETETEVREEEEEIGGPKELETKKGEEEEEGEKSDCKSTKKLGTSNASSPLPPRSKQQP
ncbi:hypothetical protein BYT27DRAFT_7213765 [Phlegmacium glaucopus]|nr:hypothetical protein BYT27DRAFT_7213765 [Phlegmacium glaucopus]